MINYPGTDYHTAAIEASQDEQWTQGERNALAALANRDPELGKHHMMNTKGSPYWKKGAGSGTIFGFGKCAFLFHQSANGVNIAKAELD